MATVKSKGNNRVKSKDNNRNKNKNDNQPVGAGTVASASAMWKTTVGTTDFTKQQPTSLFAICAQWWQQWHT